MPVNKVFLCGSIFTLILLLNACGGISGNSNSSSSSALPPPANLDQYGGMKALPSPNTSTGFFRTEKFGKRWLLVTPDNNAFWMFSVWVVGTLDGGTNYVNVAKAKYGDNSVVFSRQAARRLRGWGFNTVGEDHNSFVTPAPLYGHANDEKMPFMHLINNTLGPVRDGLIKNVIMGTDPGSCCYNGYRGGTLPDFFDPAWENGVDPSIEAWMNNWNGADPSTFPWLISLTTDDGDGFFGLRRASNPNGAWLVAATAPRQAVSGSNTNPEFSDTTVYAKLAWRDFLKAQYGNSLTALNSAWGSNYTTWNSTTAAWSNVSVGSGTGTTSLTIYLPHIPIVAGTVLVSVNGTSISSADNGAGAILGTGVAAGSTINYTNGKVVLNTTIPIPTVSGNVVASYTGDGWPTHLSGGTGLLDEDGSNSWMHPSGGGNPDYAGLSGLPAAVHTDINNFLASPNATDTNRLANHYFYFVTSHLKAPNHFPHALVSNPAPLFADLVTRPDGSGKLILQAAAAYYDWLQLSVRKPDLPVGGLGNNYLQAAYDVVSKPIFVYFIVTAAADSATGLPAADPVKDSPTQELRGQMYHDIATAALNTQGSDGVFPVVGIDFWEWTDKTTQGENSNFGLVTNLDNAYDGKEAVIAHGVDAWGYPTGGEKANYGDFLTTVTQTNSDILSTIIAGH